VIVNPRYRTGTDLAAKVIRPSLCRDARGALGISIAPVVPVVHRGALLTARRRLVSIDRAFTPSV